MSLKKDTTRLKLEDLKIGMYVTSEQLKDIYGVFIYLDAYATNRLEGKILYICKKPDKEVDRIEREYGGLCVFYQDERYLEEDYIVYE